MFGQEVQVTEMQSEAGASRCSSTVLLAAGASDNEPILLLRSSADDPESVQNCR